MLIAVLDFPAGRVIASISASEAKGFPMGYCHNELKRLDILLDLPEIVLHINGKKYRKPKQVSLRQRT